MTIIYILFAKQGSLSCSILGNKLFVFKQAILRHFKDLLQGLTEETHAPGLGRDAEFATLLTLVP